VLDPLGPLKEIAKINLDLASIASPVNIPRPGRTLGERYRSVLLTCHFVLPYLLLAERATTTTKFELRSLTPNPKGELSERAQVWHNSAGYLM
jgi:hypothetical protein